jgi:hypothetical protein
LWALTKLQKPAFTLSLRNAERGFAILSAKDTAQVFFTTR